MLYYLLAMEFLRNINKKSLASEVLYVVLNVGLAIVAMVLVRVTGTVWLALVLMLLSRWRVFAVRPRFWLANIQSDSVSLIISLSFVIFLFLANGNPSSFQVLLTQIALVVLYTMWLLLLRPKSKRMYIVMQAGVALFCGVTAVYAIAYAAPVSLTVLFIWLIGVSTGRHVLGSYDEEPHSGFLNLVFGLVIAELGWLGYHWAIAYKLYFMGNLMLPQMSIIITLVGFLMYRCYNSYRHHQKIRLNDIILPLIFSVALTLVLLLFFNSISVSSFS